jgi:hypothetical protein
LAPAGLIFTHVPLPYIQSRPRSSASFLVQERLVDVDATALTSSTALAISMSLRAALWFALPIEVVDDVARVARSGEMSGPRIGG